MKKTIAAMVMCGAVSTGLLTGTEVQAQSDIQLRQITGSGTGTLLVSYGNCGACSAFSTGAFVDADSFNLGPLEMELDISRWGTWELAAGETTVSTIDLNLVFLVDELTGTGFAREIYTTHSSAGDLVFVYDSFVTGSRIAG